MIYYSPTAKRIAQQKRWLHWLACHGPVWNPELEYSQVQRPPILESTKSIASSTSMDIETCLPIGKIKPERA